MGRKRHFKGNNSSADKKRRKDAAEKWKNTRGDESAKWTTVTENKRMEAFYRAQHFVEDGNDWELFMSSLRTTLPATFRINPEYTFAEELKQEVLGFMGEHLNIDGVDIKAVETLSWYPNGNAYKLGTDRRSIRKLEALNTLHKWMIQHTDNGNITRQEAVSMVPPLALDVKPHHKCLDMCASPGSKTSQLLEIINKSLALPEDQQGLVVANDVDTDRAYMLVHQCKRINSPLLVITTHAGQAFPPIRAENQQKNEFFDRVLCDVPCSGDGTLRKNPMIWGKWCTGMAMSLHSLQISIAKRGLQLLKAGGMMVYSTCSMSPYENEAVVAELLRTHEGQLELVDARQFLPLFKARAGLSNWYVLDDFYAVKSENRAKRDAQKSSEQQQSGDAENKEGVEKTMAAEAEEKGAAPAPVTAADLSHITDSDLKACLEMGMQYFPSFSDVPEHLNWKIKKSYFPPSEDEKQWMHLERCLRCVPQDEDSGGFFVAALRKIGDSTSSTAVPAVESDVQQAEAVSVGMEGQENGEKKDSKSKPSQRGLVEFQHWDDESFQKVREFYQFDESITKDCFFIREDQINKQRNVAVNGSKTIYFMPKSVRSLIDGDYKKQLKVVTAGIKAFEKKLNQSTGQAEYRLLQDSVHVLVDHIHARKVRVTVQDFSNILGGGLVSFSTLSAQTVQQLYMLPMGMVICVYEYNSDDVVVPEGAVDFVSKSGAHTFYAVCWKGVSKTMNVMCGKIDIEHMKHQMVALNVLRPKILPPKREVDGKEEGAQEPEVQEEVEMPVNDDQNEEEAEGCEGESDDAEDDAEA